MLKPVTISGFGAIIIWGFLLDLSTAQFFFRNEAPTIPEYGPCTTPNLERAICLHLYDCTYLFNLLLSPSIQDTDKFFLSRSQCGFRDGQVLICCPVRYRNVRPLMRQPATPRLATGKRLLPQPGQCGNVLSNRIYGGNITKIDEFPWMALIEYKKPDGTSGHHCGGSLINSRYVLTASHCVNGAGLPSEWQISRVRLGEWDTTTNPDCEVDVRGQKDCAPAHLDVPVEQAIPHPDYDPFSKDQFNDIALLRLSMDVPYTDFVRPICLPINANLRHSAFDGIMMDVAGWGKTETEAASSLKLKATVEGFQLNQCQNVYVTQGITLDNSQLCAGGKSGIDSCSGDSGGPLIVLDTTNKIRAAYFLAGVVSYGPTPCALAGWPGVYTRVGAFVDWIERTIQP